MEPINYNIQVKNPFEASLQGVQAGMQIGAQADAIKQQQLQRQQQLQLQQDLGQLANNPNAGAQDYASMMVKYPQLAEHFKNSWDVLSADQQQSKLNHSTQVYAALQTGNPQVAIDLLNKQSEAYANSGKKEDAQAASHLAQMIQLDPNTAKTTAGLMLSSIMGPEKFASTFATLGKENREEQLQPSALSKSESEATIKAVEAKNAETKTQLENTKTAADIETTRLKQQLDALDVQIRQANSETERSKLQLDRDKLAGELQVKLQTQQTDAQNQLDTVTNSLSTVNDLLKHPIMDDNFGVGSTIGKALGNIPGTHNKDFNASLDTLKSQQFLTQAKELRGMGALSDAEGARIERAVASLDRDQSPAAFKTALNTIKTTLERAQAKIVGSGKLPTQGGAFVMKHPVYGNVNDGTVNKLLQQFPGATREQVINYLKETGGK